MRIENKTVSLQTRCPGFTLIEIIIVMFIIGIASGIAGIMISRGSGGRETRAFTKDIASVLRYSRSHAVSEKKIYCFVIDRDERMLRLYSEDTDYKNITPVLTREFPEGLQASLQGSGGDSAYMEFYPYGNSTGGVIEVATGKGTAFFITVNRVTGGLKVEKAE